MNKSEKNNKIIKCDKTINNQKNNPVEGGYALPNNNIELALSHFLSNTFLKNL